MIDPTPEQIEARNAALVAWQEGSAMRKYSEFYTSFEDGYNAALRAAAGAAPQEPEDLSIMNGWLVESVGRHTCGAGMDGYGHEPGCGYEPVLKLAELDGYPKQAAEAVERVSALHQMVLRGEALKSWCKHCGTAYPCETMQALEAEHDCECYGADGVTDPKCQACAAPAQVDETKLTSKLKDILQSVETESLVTKRHVETLAAEISPKLAEWLRGDNGN